MATSPILPLIISQSKRAAAKPTFNYCPVSSVTLRMAISAALSTMTRLTLVG